MDFRRVLKTAGSQKCQVEGIELRVGGCVARQIGAHASDGQLVGWCSRSLDRLRPANCRLGRCNAAT